MLSETRFNGVSIPRDLSSSQKQLPVFVLSFIYDVAAELGLIQQPLQSDEPVFISLLDFQKAAQTTCTKTLGGVKQVGFDCVLSMCQIQSLDRHEDEVSLLCFDLIYISELLHKGYHRDDDDVLHAGKTIELNHNPIETQWPLGAGLLLV